MKILSARFRGFKRFRQTGIKDAIFRFIEPVQIVAGSNGSGKSSVLRELSPLPSVRTDFLPEIGLKELHIDHKGHQFMVKSDFRYKNGAHSFVIDGKELNTSGTTDVQTELVEKYFGITDKIRDLIYQKIQICNLTKANRKTFFLNTNPLYYRKDSFLQGKQAVNLPPFSDDFLYICIG